jgi:glycosyltransferase involved in cell wall biosynthesis
MAMTLTLGSKPRQVCMIAYTHYRSDARVRRAAETLAALPGYRVTVLALKQAETPRAYELEGVTVRELDLGKFRGRSSARYLAEYLKFLWLALFACTRGFLKGSVDIVHVHNMPNFLAFAAIVPRLFGRKLVLDVHDTLIETYDSKFTESGSAARGVLKRLLRLEEALCCRFASRVIAVNHVQKAALTGRGIPEAKITVVLNAPDPKWFNGCRNSGIGAGANGRCRMVYFGTLTQRLGIDLAIRAVGLLQNRWPGLEFHVIGDGEEREAFRHLTARLGVDQAVRFYDRVYPVDELAGILEGMDLVVVPNRRSSATELMLPVKMLEAVALGIPVVVPRLKAIRHYFPEEAVFYYEPDEVGSLAGAIEEAAGSAGRRKAKAARAREFLAEYGWERHRFELIDLYRRLCPWQEVDQAPDGGGANPGPRRIVSREHGRV